MFGTGQLYQGPEVVTSARRVASRRKAARGGECGTGGLDRADVVVQFTCPNGCGRTDAWIASSSLPLAYA
jgi:hypothetical protein